MGALYAIEKAFVQQQLSSYSTNSRYDITTKVAMDNGFNMAFALTSYSGNLDQKFEDPSIVTLEVYMYGWGVPDNSTETVSHKMKLRTHECTEAELGLIPERMDEAKFFAPLSDNRNLIARMVGNWRCFDEEQERPIELYGNYNAGTAQTLKINL